MSAEFGQNNLPFVRFVISQLKALRKLKPANTQPLCASILAGRGEINDLKHKIHINTFAAADHVKLYEIHDLANGYLAHVANKVKGGLAYTTISGDAPQASIQECCDVLSVLAQDEFTVHVTTS